MFGVWEFPAALKNSRSMYHRQHGVVWFVVEGRGGGRARERMYTIRSDGGSSGVALGVYLPSRFANHRIASDFFQT